MTTTLRELINEAIISASAHLRAGDTVNYVAIVGTIPALCETAEFFEPTTLSVGYTPSPIADTESDLLVAPPSSDVAPPAPSPKSKPVGGS